MEVFGHTLWAISGAVVDGAAWAAWTRRVCVCRSPLSNGAIGGVERTTLPGPCGRWSMWQVVRVVVFSKTTKSTHRLSIS